MLSVAAAIEPDRAELSNLSRLPGTALLTRAQLVFLTGFSLPTLKKWEKEGRGPAVIYIEGRPRTTVQAYRDWLASASSQPIRMAR